jgi:hypothetical protein
MMATPAAIQAEMDPAATGRVANIQAVVHASTTKDNVYAVGVVAPYAGRSRWIETTSADSAGDQATAILNGLKAS